MLSLVQFVVLSHGDTVAHAYFFDSLLETSVFFALSKISDSMLPAYVTVSRIFAVY